MSSTETGNEPIEPAPSDATLPDGETLSVAGSQSTAEISAAEAAPEKTETVAAAPEPELPRLLAVDTALGACSVTVYDRGENQPLSIRSIDLARGHAEALLPMIDEAMRESGTAFDALGRIVTTVGPGSFTGLRVGISAARGFGLVSNKPVVGVSTLAAFCAPFVSATETTPVIAAIDALHGNIYFQMIGAGGRMLVSPRIASLGEAIRLCAIGPVKIVGPGANLLAGRWPMPDVTAPVLVDQRPAPDIVWVARLGALANPETAKPRPLYLKAPDAHPQTAQRLPRQ